MFNISLAPLFGRVLGLYNFFMPPKLHKLHGMSHVQNRKELLANLFKYF